ncbi:GNAT family N-acetyltransferase [Alteribacter aurantiacus]|uniref:GNAT family N-acetyltransferase n=1 Tax=Alteribacter aurantiacus TaxID=254410 RepID=UPI00040DDBE6|nr:GNAT family N-acetyltransferase [Alteribacter aurantiacus]
MAYIQPIHAELTNGITMSIRTAHTTDAKEMNELTKQVIKEDNGLILTEEEYTITPEEQARRVQFSHYSPYHLLVIGKSEGTICGIASFEPEQPIKRMRHHGNVGLIVAKPFRSLGVGRKLMGSLIDWASYQTPIHKLNLEVLGNNESAIALYLRLGFEPVGCFSNHIQNKDGTFSDVYRMELPV